MKPPKKNVVYNAEQPEEVEDSPLKRLLASVLEVALKDLRHHDMEVRREVRWWFYLWENTMPADNGISFKDIADNLELTSGFVKRLRKIAKDSETN